jgi:hypothetical protein
MQMRFVPFDELDSSPNIIVDGAAGTGTVLTLSHWPKSGTPAGLKRDTSAEIVFAYLDTPSFHVQAEIASNNHFDEDGLIGIYALLDPATSEKYHLLLTDAARAGDFGVYERRDAARIAFAISAYADPETSPLPPELFALPYPKMAGELYRKLLDILPKLLTNLSDYEDLWKAEDEKLSAGEELIEKGIITIEERPSLDLAIVHIPEDLPAEHAHPFALHSRTECSRMFIVQGQRVEIQYRYESWVQLVSRRPPSRVDLKELAGELNRVESSHGRWVFDGVDRITPRLHLEGSPTTSLSPGYILKQLEHHLAMDPPAWNPYD